jgi:hypothetical protein
MTSVIPVPEGHATVAQRFNAEYRCRAPRVPKGRLKGLFSIRPFGTQGCPTAVPALKRGAILVSSLWDEGAQILVALGVLAAYRIETGRGRLHYGTLSVCQKKFLMSLMNATKSSAGKPGARCIDWG